jgi:hypothetical protein
MCVVKKSDIHNYKWGSCKIKVQKRNGTTALNSGSRFPAVDFSHSSALFWISSTHLKSDSCDVLHIFKIKSISTTGLRLDDWCRCRKSFSLNLVTTTVNNAGLWQLASWLYSFRQLLFVYRWLLNSPNLWFTVHI